MARKRISLMTAREAAKYLRVSLFTLDEIERASGLVPYRTPEAYRRYSLRMLNEYLEKSRNPSRRRESESKSELPDNLSPEERN